MGESGSNDTGSGPSGLGGLSGLGIAVIGLAGRFPGAADAAAFWRNLCQGVESISRFTADEIEQEAELIADPRFVKANGVLAGADLFDAELFGYSPREAAMIDPQQRLFLECAWQALEDAGYDAQRHTGAVGVFGGVSANSYLFNILSRPDAIREYGVLQIAVANDKDHLCSRVSYKLDLEGPSITVQTACSSSLVAVHLAGQALLAGDCDLALAGGVSVSFPQKAGYLYQKGGVLSADGHCRPFDALASGTVAGQGVGVVVLKRLAEALADGDSVRAVILGSAVNNDGARKAGYTAPRIDGQEKVLRAAQLVAGVAPETVDMLEAHGTATEMGDPIEVAALNRAFGSAAAKGHRCALGSVKGNIGHLDAAAGIAGFIKTVLAIGERQIPPSLHFEHPNPEIDFAAGPFYVNPRLAEWPAGSRRRAGVSAFGLGGTNAHVILEAAPEPAPRREADEPWQLLLLSAATATALAAATANLASHLAEHPEQALADVAFTSQVGRRQLSCRRVLVCRDRDDAAAALAAGDPLRLLTAEQGGRRPAVAFLLGGLGDHYVGMGRGLHAAEPRFREEIDRCAALLAPHLGLDLRDVLYPGWEAAAAAASAGGEGGAAAGVPDLRHMVRPRAAASAGVADGGLARTAIAQPALFAVEYALARCLMAWGVQPAAMLGHSLGEYVAACLAGVFTLEDALRLVAGRARLIEGLPDGAMLAVSLSAERTGALLGDELSLAAVNGPEQCVVAGAPGAVEALERRLAAEGTACRRIQTSHAFHSRQMAAIAEPFIALLRGVELRAPAVPYVSNVTGGWIDAAQATDPGYWLRHLCEPVRFAAGVAELVGQRDTVLVEIGPGQMLGSLAAQTSARGAGGPEIRPAIPALRHEHDRRHDRAVLLGCAGQLWLAGVSLDWTALHGGAARRRVPLPTYPFERRRFWVERAGSGGGTQDAAVATGQPATEKLADRSAWFFTPSFKRAPVSVVAAAAAVEEEGAWLLLADRHGVGQRLVERLAAAGRTVVVVAAGDAFAAAGDGRFTVDPRAERPFDALLAALAPTAATTANLPRRIVHLWSLGAAAAEEADLGGFAAAQDAGFHSLVALAQALSRYPAAGPVAVSVVADGLAAVERGDRLAPEKATLHGPLRVIPQELPNLRCRAIDVDLVDLAAGEGIDALLAELRAEAPPPFVVRRGSFRWLPLLDAAPLPAPAPGSAPPLCRAGGVYLITGGLGGLGLALAGFLVRTVGARLVLTSRTALPERSAWPDLLAAGGEAARRIHAVVELEEQGAEVLVLAADAADRQRMREVVAHARQRFGRIDGAFHAAGLPGAGLVQLKSRAAAAQVLAPKALGALVLDEVLGDRPLDFLVLFSSVAALAGEIGQVDYCAANAFLDAFAQRARLAGRPVFAVNWCQWEWDGWGAVSARLEPQLRAAMERQRRTFGLTYEEGMEALCRVLASDLPQVVVSTRGMPGGVEHPVSLAAVLEELEGVRAAPGERHGRPALTTTYVEPAAGSERQLVALWEDLLGIDGIGVGDDFFALGGDSLIGIRLLSRVRESLLADLPLPILFEKPTIRQLAAAVDAAAPPAPELAALAVRPARRKAVDATPADVDQLSEHDVDELLGRLLAEAEHGAQ